VYQPEGRPAQLFDLSTDPFQARDLAADHPDQVAELDAAFSTFLAERGCTDRRAYPPALGRAE
jgi:hypothetical protein